MDSKVDDRVGGGKREGVGKIDWMWGICLDPTVGSLRMRKIESRGSKSQIREDQVHRREEKRDCL